MSKVAEGTVDVETCDRARAIRRNEPNQEVAGRRPTYGTRAAEAARVEAVADGVRCGRSDCVDREPDSSAYGARGGRSGRDEG